MQPGWVSARVRPSICRIMEMGRSITADLWTANALDSNGSSNSRLALEYGKGSSFLALGAAPL